MERFRSYSNYTRRFSAASRSSHPHLSDAAFAAVKEYVNFLYSRTHFFPKLVELDGVASEVLHLCSPTVSSLVISFSQDGDDGTPTFVSNVLSAVVNRMPLVENVVVEGGSFVIEDDALFAAMFASLIHLRTISLPRYTSTPAIYSALAGNPSVRALWSNDGDQYAEESFDGHRDSVLRWDANAIAHTPPFSNLQCLSMSLNTVPDWLDFLAKPSFPGPNLVSLEIFVARPRAARSEDIITLFRRVLDVCPNLEDLSLSMYAHTIVATDFLQISPLGLSVLLVIVEFPYLRNFRIEHTLPLQLSDSDIATFAPFVEEFETISLNPHPLALYEPTMTVASVAHFARHCPSLDFLGLYIDGRKFPRIAEPRDMPSFTHQPFMLDVGLSPGPDDASVEALLVFGKYMGHMLPENSEIQTGYREAMHDSREFISVADAHLGLVRVPDSVLEEYGRFWDIVDGLAGYIRPELRLMYGLVSSVDDGTDISDAV